MKVYAPGMILIARDPFLIGIMSAPLPIRDSAAPGTSFVKNAVLIRHRTRQHGTSQLGVAVGEVGQVPANGVFRIRARYNHQLNRAERKQTDRDHGNDPRLLIGPSLLLRYDRRRRRPSADGPPRSPPDASRSSLPLGVDPATTASVDCGVVRVDDGQSLRRRHAGIALQRGQGQAGGRGDLLR